MHDVKLHSASTIEPAVRCRGVKKVYGQGASAVTALRGVDLDIQLGELVMLVGPSGCGKTTLISVIAGILDPSDGECHVFGQSISDMPVKPRTLFRGKNIGFVFQSFNLLPTISAEANVAVPLLLAGEKRLPALRKAREILDRVGLADRADSMPAQLSGGQQQRVAIARSLVHEPRLIVCDEPTSALDHKTGQSVMEMLREVAVRSDRALVIVTHDARIFPFADRIAKMDDGRVVELVDSPAGLPGHDSHDTPAIARAS